MKISPLNIYNHAKSAPATAFCSVNKNCAHEYETENPSTRMHPLLMKAYMLPRAALNDDIRGEYLSAKRRSSEVLDRFCEIKSKSYKIEDGSKAILERAARLLKLIEEKNWDDLSYFEDEDGKIGQVEKSGNSINVKFDIDYTDNGLTSAQVYSFKNGELKSYSENIQKYDNGDISCETYTTYENGKIASRINDLRARRGTSQIGEEFDFAKDGFIGSYKKNYSKSNNGIITYDEVFTMRDLGVIDSYIKNYKQIRSAEPEAAEQMEFSGANLVRYIKNDPLSDSQTTLEFDKGWLTRITKDGVTIPPLRSNYED